VLLQGLCTYQPLQVYESSVKPWPYSRCDDCLSVANVEREEKKKRRRRDGGIRKPSSK